MNYLVDSNIFLEILLTQEKSQEAQDALSTIERNSFFVTDFTLHSVGVRLFREESFDKFRQMMSEMIDDVGLIILSLHTEDTEQIIYHAQRFNLDFDDSYQYTVSEKHDLQIVSFDTDFDRTERGRKTPGQVLEGLQR